jgi:hypothetical protein
MRTLMRQMGDQDENDDEEEGEEGRAPRVQCAFQ